MTHWPATIHPLDTAIALESADSGLMRGRTVAEYNNMVGPFGGATAAALLRSIEMRPDRFGEPIALTVNFVAPIGYGEFQIAPTLVHTNRTNQHWTAALSQGQNVKATATAVFGVRRSDVWSAGEVLQPRVAPPEELSRTPGPEGVAFLQNYDMRFIAGPFPGNDQPKLDSTSTLWVRHEPRRQLDFPALAALADVFYPRVFARRGHPVPAGTISITTYFHADGNELADTGSDFVLATAQGQRFAAGYFDHTANLWSRSGKLLAASNQVVYYKDSFIDLSGQR